MVKTHPISGGIIIYSVPYFGVFDTEEVFGWLGLKGKGLSPPGFLVMSRRKKIS